MAVSSGTLYVTITGGAILALRDTNADGHSDVRVTFGRNGNSGLDNSNNSTAPGNPIVQWTFTGGSNQQWVVAPAN